MPDELRPLGRRELRFRRRFGYGFALASPTRVDEHGCCYMTLWWTSGYLPIVPITRYYVRPQDTPKTMVGNQLRFRFYGSTKLRLHEVARTYAFWVSVLLYACGLGAAFVSVVVGAKPNFLVAVLLALLAVVSGFVLVRLTNRYTTSRAPLRPPPVGLDLSVYRDGSTSA